MRINPTFDSTINTNSQATAIKAAINEVIALYESLFINNITVEVYFRYSNVALGNIALGAAAAINQSSVWNLTYAEYVNALQANTSSTNDHIAMSGLQTSPLASINRVGMAIHSANGRAVGLNTPALGFSVGTYDGVITANSTLSWSFTRPVPVNRLDFKSAIQHELDELLGLGSNIFANANLAQPQPQDLFAWRGFSSGYDIVTGTHNIISGNAALTLIANEVAIDLPFPVTLFNQQYSQATVDPNGQMVLKSGSFIGANTEPLPATDTPFTGEPALLPYWAGFNPSGVSDGIFTGISGTLGSRQFVVEWRTHYSDPDITDSGINFEVVLNEANDDITYIYNDPYSGMLGTIGLQSGLMFRQFSFNDPYGNHTPAFSSPHFEVTFTPSNFFSGLRNLTTTGRRYFSLNGANPIVNFNQDSLGDKGDWETTGCPQFPYYAQQAELCLEQFADISADSPEGITLDIIGYAITGTLPPIPTVFSTRNITSDAFTSNWYTTTASNGYRLDVATDGAFTNYVIQNLDIGYITGYDIGHLNHNTAYHYRLRAYNDYGLSDYSDPVTVYTFPFQSNAVYFRNIKIGTTRSGSQIFSFDPPDTLVSDLLTWDTRSGDATLLPDPYFTKQVTPASAYSVGATGYVNATGAIYYNTPQFDDVLWVGSDTLGLVNGFQYNSIDDLVSFLNNHHSHHVSATKVGGIIRLTSLISGAPGNLLPLRVDSDNAGSMAVSAPTLIGGVSLGIGTPVVPTVNFTGYYEADISGTGIYVQELTGMASGILILPYNKTFTGTWDMQTGRLTSFVDYRQSGFFNAAQDTYIYESGRVTSKLDNFFINVPYTTTVGTGIDIVNLFISGYNTIYSVKKSITGVR